MIALWIEVRPVKESLVISNEGLVENLIEAGIPVKCESLFYLSNFYSRLYYWSQHSFLNNHYTLHIP